jgi:hypothetical protein
MERRFLHRLWHRLALLSNEKLGNLFQLFLQTLVLLNEELYQKAVLLNLLLQSVKLCLELYDKDNRQNTEITVFSQDEKDYISLTDMANGKKDESRAADVIKNWISTR